MDRDIPVMNGVDPGDRIRSPYRQGDSGRFPDLYRTFANDDYSITQQGDFANLRLESQMQMKRKRKKCLKYLR